ncbi:unnamed protein product [Symbiodinium sp. CCMP2592]|nr:unnamed protein product [Symbiodinium sp. CCMP2592]
MPADGLEECLGSPSPVLPGKEDETCSEGSGASARPESTVQIVESFVQFMVEMKATRPSILRGIPVHPFLQQAPRKWPRNRKDSEQLYRLSQVVTRFDEFWSHSWRTKAWLKYLNILYLHNSRPAFVVGMFCASAAFFFCRAGIVPVRIAGAPNSFWCSVAGAVGYYSTLLFWRRSKLAFLDIACINQKDHASKVEGMLSIGAFLKNSQSLLVLWDETYVSRLWCVFEMAAFLHSKGLSVEAEDCLAVCPVFVGPTLLVAQLSLSILMAASLTMGFALVSYVLIFQATLALPCFLLLAYVVLAHCHSIDVVQSQVSSFTIEDASCHCCSRGLCETICDRMLIVRCIEAWFGSVDKFEAAVRGEVRRTLVHQLANNIFSYWRMVHALCPLLWFFLDLMSAPGMTMSHTISYTLGGLTSYLLLMPSMDLICLRLCYRLRKSFHGSRCYKLLLSAGMVAVGTLFYAIYFAVDQIILAQLLDTRFQSAIPRATFVLAVSSVGTFLLWRRCPSM